MDAKELLATLRGHYIAETTQTGTHDGGVFASEVAVNGSWGWLMCKQKLFDRNECYGLAVTQMVLH